jgi:HNH endonuclease
MMLYAGDARIRYAGSIMEKQRCIICDLYKPQEDFNIEHIFPEAIGGRLTTKRVCTSCNSFLGSHVDAPLTNHFMIELTRHVRHIPSKEGVVPNPFTRGHLRDNPEQKAKWLSDGKGNMGKLEFTTQVRKTNDEHGNPQFAISVDESNSNEIPKIIQKLARRTNTPEPTNEEMTAMLASAKVQTFDQPWIDFKVQMDFENYKKGILKIAYEMAFYWLGEHYLDDPTARRIRTFLANPNANQDAHQIRGRIDLASDDKSISKLWKNDTHIALLKQTENFLTCTIRIFNTFEGVIYVSEDASLYALVQERFIELDPTSKSIRELPLLEEIRRLVKTNGAKDFDWLSARAKTVDHQ